MPLADQLEEHEQDLIIADSSPHGWLAVSKLRTTKVHKRLAAGERDLAQQKQKKYEGPGKKFSRFSAQSSEGDFKKPERRYLSEALFAASKQLRQGLCSQTNSTTTTASV
jgi:hypothetical protein